MNKLITLDLLKAKCACKTQRDLFERIAGSSIVLTKQWCLDNAQHFQWDWAAQYLLPDAAQAEFDRVRRPARAEYRRVWDAARNEYERVTAPARAEHQRVADAARAEFDRVRRAAWAEYGRVADAAWAECERVTAPAWAEYGRVADAAWAEYRRVQAVTFFNLYDFDKVPE